MSPRSQRAAPCRRSAARSPPCPRPRRRRRRRPSRPGAPTWGRSRPRTRPLRRNATGAHRRRRR
ncbi:MAG: hypothetical protein CSA65_06805 [Proteobacteria bacterium]|nr:MAG: hypothetical protein CSA65_06805 [Pseudomonadota bacterium]